MLLSHSSHFISKNKTKENEMGLKNYIRPKNRTNSTVIVTFL